MKIKLRSERKGDHVHVDVFMGSPYALTGNLIMLVGEWQVFGAALYAARDSWPPGTLVVEEEELPEGWRERRAP